MALLGKISIKQQIEEAISRRIMPRLEQQISTVGKARAANLILRGLQSQLGDDEAVAERAYECNPWVYICVRRRADCLSQVPFIIYHNDEPQEKGTIVDLFQNPNPEMSDVDLFSATSILLDLFGSAFWVFFWGRHQNRMPTTKDIPREIWPFPPGGFTAVVDDRTKIISAWKYQKGNEKEIFTPEQVIHFRYYSPYNEIKGQAAKEAAGKTIETEWASKVFERAMYGNSCIPGGIIKLSPDVSDKEKDAFRNSIEGRHKGEKRSHRLAIVRGGEIEWIPTIISLKDMLAADLHKLNRDETLIVFGETEASLGFGDVKYSNVKEARRTVWQDSRLPVLRMWERKLKQNFFKRFGLLEQGFSGWFDTSTIPEFQEDENEKWQRVIGLWDRGIPWAVLNDRFDLDLEVERIPNAEVGFASQMMIPVGGVEPEGMAGQAAGSEGKSEVRAKPMPREIAASPPADPLNRVGPGEEVRTGGVSQAVIKRLAMRRDAYQRQLRPLQNKYADAMHTWVWELRKEFLAKFFSIVKSADFDLPKKIIQKQELDPTIIASIEAMLPQLDAQIVKLMGMSKPHLEKAMELGGQQVFIDLMARGRDLGIFKVDSEMALQYLLNRTMQTRIIAETAHEALKATLIEGFREGWSINQITDKIKLDFGTLDGRVRTIAHEEIVGTAENGKYIAMKESSIKLVQWMHGGSTVSNPREDHIACSGEIVEFGELFSCGLAHPHDWDNGDASTNLNCHCTIFIPETDAEGHQLGIEDIL